MEKKEFITFLNEGLSLDIQVGFLGSTLNDERIKKYVGKIIGKISVKLYQIIQERATELNIYTFEIASYSKVYKIFICKEFTFEGEKILRKELLIHLLNGKHEGSFFTFLKSLPPQPFENHEINDYVKSLLMGGKRSYIIEELESICEDSPLKKDRLEALKQIEEDSWEESDEENGGDDELPF